MLPRLCCARWGCRALPPPCSSCTWPLPRRLLPRERKRSQTLTNEIIDMTNEITLINTSTIMPRGRDVYSPPSLPPLAACWLWPALPMRSFSLRMTGERGQRRQQNTHLCSPVNMSCSDMSPWPPSFLACSTAAPLPDFTAASAASPPLSSCARSRFSSRTCWPKGITRHMEECKRAGEAHDE